MGLPLFPPFHHATAPVITGVLYCYSDRRNGWYCFAHDAEGNQVGDAVYLYTKAEIVAEAKAIATQHNVKAKRG
jgi:hypothetical protein